MGNGTSQENTPISSTTDESIGDDSICSICGGLGYVRQAVPVDHPDFGKLVRCPEHHTDLDSERIERLRKLSNLDAFADKTFENFRTDFEMFMPRQLDSLKAAYDAAWNFANKPEDWLLLEGTYGCGKTHLAAAIGNWRLTQGDTVLFITAPDLLDHLRSTFYADSEISYDAMFDRLRNAPLLILDDLGVEKPSEWALEKLFQLLNHRHSYRLPTVITTNTDIDLLDRRVRSRLLDTELTTRLVISTPDYRTGIPNEYDMLMSNLDLYKEMRFDNFDTITNTRSGDNLERALEVAKAYAQETERYSLVITGNYGVGKTHLAAAIAHHWFEHKRDVMFVTVPDLMDYIRVTFSPGEQVTYNKRFEMIRNAPYLILDHLGAEHSTGWVKEKLFQIVDYRYIKKLPTVITSAKRIDELDERIHTRLLDRRFCAIFAIQADAYVSRMRRS
jgi:DNA replication protein DnaC